jgi:hypothetical protein
MFGRLLLSAVIVSCVSGFAIADEEKVTVVEGTPPTAEKGDVFRFVRQGIAGSTITAKVTKGDAKLVTRSIKETVNGKPKIGVNKLEFDLNFEKGGKGGKVTLVIESTSPNNPNPQKETIEIEVK